MKPDQCFPTSRDHCWLLAREWVRTHHCWPPARDWVRIRSPLASGSKLNETRSPLASYLILNRTRLLLASVLKLNENQITVGFQLDTEWKLNHCWPLVLDWVRSAWSVCSKGLFLGSVSSPVPLGFGCLNIKLINLI